MLSNVYVIILTLSIRVENLFHKKGVGGCDFFLNSIKILDRKI